MKVAVVTPYYKEDAAILRQAHDSVRRQTRPCHHVLVADGHPQDEPARWQATQLALAASHGDNGNTPRGIGAMMAACQGFDAIAFLDADNWYEPDHVESLVVLHEATGAAVCTSGRLLVGIDGAVLDPHDRHVDGWRFVDTSCFLLTRAAFRVLPFWLNLPAVYAPTNDVYFLMTLAAGGVSLAHTGRPTMAFRSYYGIHYVRAGRPVPQAARRDLAAITRAKLAWCGLAPSDKAALLACHLTPAERDAFVATSERGSTRAPTTAFRLRLNSHVTEIEETQIRNPLLLEAKGRLSRPAGGGQDNLAAAERILNTLLLTFPDDSHALDLRRRLDDLGRKR